MKACIFDLDGTLLNTLPALTYTCNLTLDFFHLPRVGIEQVKHFVGDGATKLIERCLQFAGGDIASTPVVLEKYLDYFQEGCLYEIAPYPGIPEALETAKKNGMKLAVVSNKPQPMTDKNIYTIFGHDMFDVVIGARKDMPRKPDPTGALLAAKQMNVLPAETYYIGDTNTDMKTGIAAQMVTCGAIWGFRGREELATFAPNYLLETPFDLIPILASK